MWGLGFGGADLQADEGIGRDIGGSDENEVLVQSERLLLGLGLGFRV